MFLYDFIKTYKKYLYVLLRYTFLSEWNLRDLSIQTFLFFALIVNPKKNLLEIISYLQLEEWSINLTSYVDVNDYLLRQ